MKIAINVVATNRYIYFLNDLCDSISSFLDTENNEVNLIVYTNVDIPESIYSKHSNISIKKRYIDHEPWPYPTLKRFHYFIMEKDFLISCDYSYYIDVDSIFIGKIKDQIFTKEGTVGTIHPCLSGGIGTPERNPLSQAYIPLGSNNKYFCGGFFGGTGKSFVSMTESIKESIEKDMGNGIMAIWHDESHLNKFFYENPPELILETPFAVAENYTNKEKESVILFIDKNSRGGHQFFRE